MSKERLKLHAKLFVGDSGPAKLVSAVVFLLENTPYKLDIIAVNEDQLEHLAEELEGRCLLGRLRLKVGRD